jgi:hypothetical protein
VFRLLIPALALAVFATAPAMAKPFDVDAEAARIAAEMKAAEDAAPTPALFLPSGYASVMKGGNGKPDTNGNGSATGNSGNGAAGSNNGNGSSSSNDNTCNPAAGKSCDSSGRPNNGNGNGNGNGGGACPAHAERCKPVGAPGPLPLLGLGAAFGASRRIRRRIALG